MSNFDVYHIKKSFRLTGVLNLFHAMNPFSSLGKPMNLFFTISVQNVANKIHKIIHDIDYIEIQSSKCFKNKLVRFFINIVNNES